MITEDYCSYEVAKLLKEKGFDEETEDYYCKKDKSLEWASAWTMALPDEYYPCPTMQMAMKWLREKGFYIDVRLICNAYQEICFV